MQSSVRSICRYCVETVLLSIRSTSSILLSILLVHVFLVTVDSAVVGWVSRDGVESVVCMHARICNSKTVVSQ